MNIESSQIEAAQASWGQAVVGVGAASSWEQARVLAQALVEQHYLLGDGTLLFCPTMAAEKQFRSSLEEAVSYFVGGDPDHVEDKGFALAPWVSVRFENAGIVCKGELGLAMGNYFFTREDGSEQKVEYSFVYIRDGDGSVKIQLHHSALPYGG